MFRFLTWSFSLSTVSAVVLPLVEPRANGSGAALQMLPVANFQDLSAILSLLAADTVEKKLSSESNFDWERMSSVWSIFGLVGALRAYLKIAASVSGSERAGVELFGAAGFTARQTFRSLCYWKVGRLNSPLMWRDSTNQLLSRLDAGSSPWIHPLCIGVGYSRCPWDSSQLRCVLEFVIPILWALLTMVVFILPALVLMPSLHELGKIQCITLGVQAATACFAGSITPLLLHRLNSFGLAHLTQISKRRLHQAVPIVEGDHVVTSAKQNVRHVLWQAPSTEASLRSGDYWPLRLLCAFNAIAILAAYLSNYIALGSAAVTRQYAWLAIQILILTCRYILWAVRPVWSPQRPPCLLYIVCGSVVGPLPVECSVRLPASALQQRLDPLVVEFACASTCSKQSNRGFPPDKVQRNVLMKLASVAPPDIIYSEYTAVGSHYNPTTQQLIEILRLPWSFVEELYIGQGIVLGPNPWALGGLYLGAVILKDKFLGLTTLHPFSAHVNHCTFKGCAANHGIYSNHAITLDGYLVSDTTYGQILRPFHRVEDGLVEWHRKFRENVDTCRQSAKTNGPSNIEIRASSFGPIPQLRMDITRTHTKLELDFVKAAVKDAQEKNHRQCDPWVCEIDSFGNGTMQTPKQLGVRG